MKASYTETRTNFAALWDRVIDHRETLIVHRRGSEDIAVLPASELSSLQETAYLLRSPRNAQRLLAALTASMDQQGEAVEPETLRAEVAGEG